MDAPALEQLVTDVASGACSVEEAVRRLRRLPFADLGFARVDHHREVRQEIPEAVYGPGKTPEQCARIVVELLSQPGGPVLLTRASAEQVKASTAATRDLGYGSPTVTDSGTYATVAWRAATGRPGMVLVLTAGTADLPVADECRNSSRIAVSRACTGSWHRWTTSRQQTPLWSWPGWRERSPV
jgi:hypothetical protein